MERNGLYNKLFDWLLSVFGLILVTLVFGSYGFTWLVDLNQTKEKQDWRQQHVKDHKQELVDLKKDVKESIDSIREELRNNQSETRELLEKMIQMQERVNFEERRKK